MVRSLIAKIWPKEAGSDAKRPSIPEGMRVYAIGDIHGRADLLEALHHRIDRDSANQPDATVMEIYLGDYIDRGPDSRRVIDLLIERQNGPQTCVLLKGNHEQTALRFLSDPGLLKAWRNHGGYEFLVSYGVTPPSILDDRACEDCRDELEAALPPAHLRFLSHLCLSTAVGDYFFVHAGVRPGRALDEQEEEDLLWIRGEFLSSNRAFGKVVVHGHTPVDEAEFLDNRINIDTGAFAIGNLSCLVLTGSDQALL